MGNIFAKAALPLVLVSGVLTGCASTSSTGDAPLNQKNWPWCSLIGGLAGGGLGAIESSAWAGGGAAAGAVIGGLLCYAQDGDQDEDGVHDRRDRCPDTPKGTEVRHNGCPLPQYPEAAPAPAAAPPQDEVIVLSDLGDVLFAFDSAKLTPAAEATLDSVVEKLRGADVLAIRVDGHTDSVGSDAYNQSLSERRAASVVDYLISQGVAAQKLSSHGFGESKPLEDNGTDAGRAQNRRVEIHVDR
ncbi:OmpA family protein [Geopseudomonas sagittaria]|uniref:OmpA family protein n=1 Tax=Geopseudomonas sagittaria TaxID=1135990 RepID=A0A1I5W1B6_9GAMM|nr:OmpA family protein [Pseudomonas sagittaria]MCM2330141.1 OmpA family protein [Pseudomonas sagittaria]SFQ13377.1 OmpA family protein [Pseudomonas sagittaria]